MSTRLKTVPSGAVTNASGRWKPSCKRPRTSTLPPSGCARAIGSSSTNDSCSATSTRVSPPRDGSEPHADARVASLRQHRRQIGGELAQQLLVAAASHRRQDQMRRRLDDAVHPQRPLHELVRRRAARRHQVHDLRRGGIEPRVRPRLGAPLFFRRARDHLVDARRQRQARRRRWRLVVTHRLRERDRRHQHQDRGELHCRNGRAHRFGAPSRLAALASRGAKIPPLRARPIIADPYPPPCST